MGDLSNILGGSFNPEDVPPSEYEVLPEGDYPAVIESGLLQPTKNGGQGILFTFSILGTQYDGRKITSFINLVNSNPKAETIGRQELAKICMSCGLVAANDTKEFEGKKLKIRLGVEKGVGTYINKYGEEKPSQDQNKVKTYLPLNAIQATTQPAQQHSEQSEPVPQQDTQKSRPWA